MSVLNLENADGIVDKALAVGRANGMDPLTVVVLDAGGHILVLKREDNASFIRPDLAIAKAFGALGMGASSRANMERFDRRPNFQSALVSIHNGKYAPVPGGVLIRGANGAIIGAVGVTGDASDRDELCAILAIQGQGFVSEPENPVPDAVA